MIARGDSSKGEIEILKPDMIFSNQYVQIYNDVVKFPAGNQGTYIRLSSGTNKSVAVFPVTKDNSVVVLRNYRHGVRGWGVEIPKGAVDLNDTS